jgi:phenylalanyl-tRNA synthetase beta chain
MKLSLNWLKDYIDIEMSPDDLAHLLTMAGLEVEGVEPAGQSLAGIVASKILEVTPHPESDRLSLCRVDMGKGAVHVVCGAPNVAAGAMVAYAPAGQTLPNGVAIKEEKFRGVVSKGVLLAEDELGLTDDHSGVMILPPDSKPGADLYASISGPGSFSVSDWVLDLSITPNRPDWASVMGVAREIAAITGKKLKTAQIQLNFSDTHVQDLAHVTIHDPNACPRYAAGVIQGINLTRAPFWMRYRLFLAGIRSINNVVDVTNYVLMETGQPLHAFDYNRLKKNRIEVRRAAENETFTTLDNISRTLSCETLLICDGERPVALAGIMGGLNSEICETTVDVLLESAFFDPVTIRRGSKHLGLSTEASYRFERGADIGGVLTALKRAMSLISDLAGGQMASGILDQYPRPHVSPKIRIRVDRVNRILGTKLTQERIGKHLEALEMGVQFSDGHELNVIPPTFRVDITREADLIEEVARLHGYENIPISYPNIQPDFGGESRELALRSQIRPIMTGLGFTEIITYSFISPDSPDKLDAEEESPLRATVHVLNPLAMDQSVMRTSLIPGILAAVRTNISHDEKGLKLFEWGKVFFQKPEAQLPDEKLFLAALITGICQQKTWYCEERKVDFYDIKGDLEALLADLALENITFCKGYMPAAYDPERSANVLCDDSLVGRVGRLSAHTMEAFDLKKEDALIFELDVGILCEKAPSARRFHAFAKFPAVYRDISLLASREVESARIVDIVKQHGSDWVESVHLFDLYEGKNLSPSEKALSLRVCYRAKDRTLDGVEVNQLHEAIVARIRQETGGRLREG